MTNSETGEPRYLSDAYELENFELPVSDDEILERCILCLVRHCIYNKGQAAILFMPMTSISILSYPV